MAVRALARGIDTDPARIASDRETGSAPSTTPGASTGYRRTSCPAASTLFARSWRGSRPVRRGSGSFRTGAPPSETDYRKVAERLSEGRSSAARRLADEVTLRMRELGMDGGAFSVAT